MPGAREDRCPWRPGLTLGNWMFCRCFVNKRACNWHRMNSLYMDTIPDFYFCEVPHKGLFATGLSSQLELRTQCLYLLSFSPMSWFCRASRSQLLNLYLLVFWNALLWIQIFQLHLFLAGRSVRSVLLSANPAGSVNFSAGKTVDRPWYLAKN